MTDDHDQRKKPKRKGNYMNSFNAGIGKWLKQHKNKWIWKDGAPRYRKALGSRRGRGDLAILTHRSPVFRNARDFALSHDWALAHARKAGKNVQKRRILSGRV